MVCSTDLAVLQGWHRLRHNDGLRHVDHDSGVDDLFPAAAYGYSGRIRYHTCTKDGHATDGVSKAVGVRSLASAVFLALVITA